MTKEIAYGSLCTGYDGLGKALTLAGVQHAARFHAETEPSVAHLLKLAYPGVLNVGDIKTVPWGRAPHIDILSSGDPCQSISIAGRQAGREDPRFLWPYVRDAYRTMLPGAIFFENVANIVGHDGGRTMAERFEHLRADGYEVRWTVLGACAVGAPHHRHRWYAVAAYRGRDARPAVRVGGKKAICGAPRSGGRYLLPTPLARDGDGRGEGDAAYWATHELRKAPLGAIVKLLPTPRTTDVNGPGRGATLEGSDDLRTVVSLLPTPTAGDANGGHVEPVIGGVRPSGAKRMDSLGSVSALLPTPTATNSHGNTRNNRGEPLLPGISALLPTPDASAAIRGGLLAPELAAARIANPDRATNLEDIVAVHEGAWGRFAEAVALWEQITGHPVPSPTEMTATRTRRLSPALPEWMMGLEPGELTDTMARKDALRAAGNGVVARAAAAAWNLLTSS